MPEGTPSEKASRAETSRASALRGDESPKEVLLSPVIEKYKSLQMQIIGLEKDLDTGNEKAANVQDPRMRQLGIEIGKGIQKQLEGLRKQREELEKQLVNLGGEPSDYTVQ